MSVKKVLSCVIGIGILVASFGCHRTESSLGYFQMDGYDYSNISGTLKRALPDIQERFGHLVPGETLVASIGGGPYQDDGFTWDFITLDNKLFRIRLKDRPARVMGLIALRERLERGSEIEVYSLRLGGDWTYSAADMRFRGFIACWSPHDEQPYCTVRDF